LDLIGQNMRTALYARISTIDKDQNPETQLMPLHDYCNARGWEIYKEHVDAASVLDITHRKAWQEMLDDAMKRTPHSVDIECAICQRVFIMAVPEGSGTAVHTTCPECNADLVINISSLGRT